MSDKTAKPRVCFCWWCGRKFYGNHFEKIMYDEALRVVHKACKKEMTIDNDKWLRRVG